MEKMGSGPRQERATRAHHHHGLTMPPLDCTGCKSPNSPFSSSLRPAVKYKTLGLPAWPPFPKASDQSPSFTIGRPRWSVSCPRKLPVEKSKAFIVPSPKLATSSALLKGPKSAAYTPAGSKIPDPAVAGGPRGTCGYSAPHADRLYGDVYPQASRNISDQGGGGPRWTSRRAALRAASPRRQAFERRAGRRWKSAGTPRYAAV